MPRASKFHLKNSIKEDIEDNFAFLISSLTMANEIEQFFTDFLTQEEKIMLYKRLMLYLMLENRYEDAQIQHVLGISKETIRTHKTKWLLGNYVYKTILNKLIKREKTKVFWTKLDHLLAPVDLLLKAKTDMKARSKFRSGDY